MKGNYVTPTGEVKNVVDFDEANKIACVRLGNTNNQWVHESEYSTWIKQEEETPDAGSEEIADVIEETKEEAPEVAIEEVDFVEETTAGLEHNPITEEPKKKKAAPKKKTK